MLNARALILRKKVGHKTGSFYKLFEYENALCSNEHYLSSNENKAWIFSGRTKFKPKY